MRRLRAFVEWLHWLPAWIMIESELNWLERRARLTAFRARLAEYHQGHYS